MLTQRVQHDLQLRPAVRRARQPLPPRDMVGVFHLERPTPARRVAAAFAYERDARSAVELIRSADIPASFSWRHVRGEHGEVQLVVLDVELARPTDAGRVETLITGAHGARVPLDRAPACGVPVV